MVRVAAGGVRPLEEEEEEKERLYLQSGRDPARLECRELCR